MERLPPTLLAILFYNPLRLLRAKFSQLTAITDQLGFISSYKNIQWMKYPLKEIFVLLNKCNCRQPIMTSFNIIYA